MRSLVICIPHPKLCGYKKENNEIWGGGHFARMVEGRCVYRVLVGKPEGKSPLRGPRHKWEDNIRVDLHKVGFRV